jgi:hypothetical protein
MKSLIIDNSVISRHLGIYQHISRRFRGMIRPKVLVTLIIPSISTVLLQSCNKFPDKAQYNRQVKTVPEEIKREQVNPQVKAVPEEIKREQVNPQVYRLLTSVANYTPDLSSVSNLCIRSKNFHLSIPQGRIASAREISIPVREETYEKVNVERSEPKIVTKQESKYGIKFEPETETVYVRKLVEETQMRVISGLCIGSEYILD